MISSNISGLNVGDQQYSEIAKQMENQSMRGVAGPRRSPKIHLRYKNLSPINTNITQGVISSMKSQTSGRSSPSYGARDAFGNLIAKHPPFVMPFKPSGPLGKFGRKDQRTSGQRSLDKLDSYFGQWNNSNDSDEGDAQEMKTPQ